MKLISYGMFLKSKVRLVWAYTKMGTGIRLIFDWKMGLALLGLACLKVRVGKNK